MPDNKASRMPCHELHRPECYDVPGCVCETTSTASVLRTCGTCGGDRALPIGGSRAS